MIATASGHGAGRGSWLAPALMVAGALSVALVSYSFSMKVSGERAAVERLERANRALEQDLTAKEAELRVRMRLPQLERWNMSVLGLKPIEAAQFLSDPLRLADYGVQPAPSAKPELAVLRNAPTADTPLSPGGAPLAPRARLVTAAAPPPAGIDPALITTIDALAASEPRPAAALTPVSLSGPPPPNTP